MSSLTSCLKSAGNALSVESKRAVLTAAQQYRRDGMSPQDAAALAVDDQIAKTRQMLRDAEKEYNDGRAAQADDAPRSSDADRSGALQGQARRGADLDLREPAAATQDAAPVPAEVLADLATIDRWRAKNDPANPTRLVVVPPEDVHAGLATALGTSFNVPVYFIRNELGEGTFGGVTYKGRVYISVDSPSPSISVAVHEVGHNLPDEIRNRMVNAIMETVSPAQEAEFFRLLPMYKQLPRDKQREEIAMRIIEQDSQNPGFWLALQRKLGMTEFGKLVNSILGTLDKIISGFSKYDSSQFTTDIKRVREAVADAYAAALAQDEYNARTQGGKKALLKPMASARQATPLFKDDRTAGPRKAGDETVSTRVPSSVNPGENAITDHLLVGMGVVNSNPGLLKKHADLIRNDAAHKPRGRLSDEEVINTFIESMKQNLLYLFDSMPERNRLRSMNWYKGANRIAGRLSDAASISKRAASGVLASLSPQTPWDVNVSQAGRVISIWNNQQRTKTDDVMNVWFQGKIDALEEAGKPSEVMSRIAGYLRGKSLQEIDDLNLQAWWVRAYDETHHDRSYWLVAPEGDPVELMRNKPKRPGEPGAPSNMPWGNAGNIAKAISILKDDSIGNISAQLGAEHKVRSFYNNIVEPDNKNGHVTIDTHAVAAARLEPLSGNSPEVGQAWGGQGSSSVFGQGGLYGEYAEAYRRAAAERGVLPREMQSVTWEAVRGLFDASFKTQEAANDIKRIWIQHQKGTIDLAAARQRVVERAGGLAGPNWSGAGNANAQDAGPAGNGREPQGGAGPGQVAPAFSERAAPAQTDTPAFKAWFGDSKVVDAQGKPLVVYHSTLADGGLDVFHPSSHFGSAAAANARIGTAKADRMPAGDATDEAMGESITPAYLSIKNPMRVDDQIVDWAPAIKRAKSLGHDGLVYKNVAEDFGSDSYVAFKPTQIKSATGNRGTFDAKNSDIRFSESQPKTYTPLLQRIAASTESRS